MKNCSQNLSQSGLYLQQYQLKQMQQQQNNQNQSTSPSLQNRRKSWFQQKTENNDIKYTKQNPENIQQNKSTNIIQNNIDKENNFFSQPYLKQNIQTDTNQFNYQILNKNYVANQNQNQNSYYQTEKKQKQQYQQQIHPLQHTLDSALKRAVKQSNKFFKPYNDNSPKHDKNYEHNYKYNKTFSNKDHSLSRKKSTPLLKNQQNTSYQNIHATSQSRKKSQSPWENLHKGLSSYQKSPISSYKRQQSKSPSYNRDPLNDLSNQKQLQYQQWLLEQEKRIDYINEVITNIQTRNFLKKNFFSYEQNDFKNAPNWGMINSYYFIDLVIEEFPDVLKDHQINQEIIKQIREKLVKLISKPEDFSNINENFQQYQNNTNNSIEFQNKYQTPKNNYNNQSTSSKNKQNNPIIYFVDLQKLQIFTKNTGLLGIILQVLKEFNDEEKNKIQDVKNSQQTVFNSIQRESLVCLENQNLTMILQKQDKKNIQNILQEFMESMYKEMENELYKKFNYEMSQKNPNFINIENQEDDNNNQTIQTQKPKNSQKEVQGIIDKQTNKTKNEVYDPSNVVETQEDDDDGNQSDQKKTILKDNQFISIQDYNGKNNSQNKNFEHKKNKSKITMPRELQTNQDQKSPFRKNNKIIDTQSTLIQMVSQLIECIDSAQLYENDFLLQELQQENQKKNHIFNKQLPSDKHDRFITDILRL
ncbi:hypothetical protein PPERSA_08951 [Pseudocohnilembus persalinus]|uniref:Uncharacterized protein n=1 Tax=Pseudocohnilembus persalinus TaxID=266149 RepID=A0A0V0R2V7_PSEPJ|nr:hypothetical protein PPERSA_08951 [Pseudocohnilembus persalinus]|eukprot:KRX08847.1 hypothetical protein PPERSA_08951 [Pseudocohnilembus persalinus]